MRVRETWGWLVVTLLLGAGCEEPVAATDLRSHVEALCAEYCPLRIACVRDGWAGGSVKQCVRACADERLYERGGEPSPELLGQLECLAALSCEELPAAVQGGEAVERPCGAEAVDLDPAPLDEE